MNRIKAVLFTVIALILAPIEGADAWELEKPTAAVYVGTIDEPIPIHWTADPEADYYRYRLRDLCTGSYIVDENFKTTGTSIRLFIPIPGNFTFQIASCRTIRNASACDAYGDSRDPGIAKVNDIPMGWRIKAEE